MQWIRASLLWGAFVVFSAIPALAQGTISFSIGDSRPRPILNAPYSVVEVLAPDRRFDGRLQLKRIILLPPFGLGR